MSLEEFYGLLEQQLSAQTRALKTLVSHRSSIGWVNEQAFGGMLRNHLPKQCSLGSGFVLSPDGTKTSQGDVLIFDEAAHPVLFREGGLVVICPEALLGVIEIKTSSSKQFMKDAIANIASYKAVRPCFGAVFVLQPPVNWDTAQGHLEDAWAEWAVAERPPFAHLPDVVTYLGKWTAHWKPTDKSWICQDTKNLTLLSFLNTLLTEAISTLTLKKYMPDIESDLLATLDWS